MSQQIFKYTGDTAHHPPAADVERIASSDPRRPRDRRVATTTEIRVLCYSSEDSARGDRGLCGVFRHVAPFYLNNEPEYFAEMPTSSILLALPHRTSHYHAIRLLGANDLRCQIGAPVASRSPYPATRDHCRTRLMPPQLRCSSSASLFLLPLSIILLPRVCPFLRPARLSVLLVCNRPFLYIPSLQSSLLPPSFSISLHFRCFCPPDSHLRYDALFLSWLALVFSMFTLSSLLLSVS